MQAAVAHNAMLQFANTPKIQKTDIIVGLDFGTSCTRVVMQSPHKLGGRTMAVPFEGSSHPAFPYLVPSCVFRGPCGTLFLTPVDGWKRLHHLKVALLDHLGPAGDPSIEGLRDLLSAYTAGYLALVLREARRWFFASQFESYGQDEIVWSLNLGIPSAGYGDELIRRCFETIAKAAWVLSTEGGPIRLETAADAIDLVGHDDNIGVAVAVVPEVAAQVVGYARSPYRKEGLHVLIDVGASTLDICSFLLRQDQEGDIYTFLTADVTRLGLLELHRRRMEAVGYEAPFDRIPDDLVGALPTWRNVWCEGERARQLQTCDGAFREECLRRLIRTVADLRRRRDPRSPRWREGLPVFLAGGGVLSDVFYQFIDDAQRTAMRYWDIGGLRGRPLPVPQVTGGDGRLVPYEVFNRISVAHGLSHDAINIGRIEPPGEVPDVQLVLRPRPWEDGYIGPEQV